MKTAFYSQNFLLVFIMNGHFEIVAVINKSLHPHAFKAIKQHLAHHIACIDRFSSKKGWMDKQRNLQTGLVFPSFVSISNSAF